MAAPTTRTRTRRPPPPVALPEPPPEAVLPAAPVASERFVWTRERYEQAVGAGIFGPEDRLHLIRGELILKMSQNEPHAVATVLAAEALRAAFGSGSHVREEKPLALSASSVPEPDLAVVQGAARAYLSQHPSPADVWLLVEVASSSLARDRTRMAALYAEADVPEYWIVNLPERTVEVHREPVAGAYRTKTTHAAGDTVSPLHAPGAAIPVANLLP